MILNKKFWDETFETKWIAYLAASQIVREHHDIGLPWQQILDAGCQFISEFNEREENIHHGTDEVKAPKWTQANHELYDPLSHCNSITANGLLYKTSKSYMTADGWPTGTTCWYSRIHYGSFYLAAADRSDVAMLRTIILMGCLFRKRQDHPNSQTNLHLVLRQLRESVKE